MEYGHRHLGIIYKPLLTICEDGLNYQGKRYRWDEIINIIKYDNKLSSPLFYQGGTPLSYIYLSDGKSIRVRGGTLEITDIKASRIKFNGKTKAYTELIKTIEEHQRLYNTYKTSGCQEA